MMINPVIENRCSKLKRFINIAVFLGQPFSGNNLSENSGRVLILSACTQNAIPLSYLSFHKGNAT